MHHFIVSLIGSIETSYTLYKGYEDVTVVYQIVESNLIKLLVFIFYHYCAEKPVGQYN